MQPSVVYEALVLLVLLVIAIGRTKDGGKNQVCGVLKHVAFGEPVFGFLDLQSGILGRDTILVISFLPCFNPGPKVLRRLRSTLVANRRFGDYSGSGGSGDDDAGDAGAATTASTTARAAAQKLLQDLA